MGGVAVGRRGAALVALTFFLTSCYSPLDDPEAYPNFQAAVDVIQQQIYSESTEKKAVPTIPWKDVVAVGNTEALWNDELVQPERVLALASMFVERHELINPRACELGDPIECRKVWYTLVSTEDVMTKLGFQPEQMEMTRDLLYVDLEGSFTGTSDDCANGWSPVRRPGWIWPVGPNYPITSCFGGRSDPFTGRQAIHNGVDIAVTAGTPVLAAHGGQVKVAGWYGGCGITVLISPPEGSTDGAPAPETGFGSQYCHLNQLSVQRNQVVQDGQIIGYSGNTGESTGQHLHFEVWQNGTRIDPMSMFR